MKPLPRENRIWESLRARIFTIFDTFFTVSSRIHILSTFYRILSVFGLHFGTHHLSKIEPKMLQNSFRYGVKILINLEVDFDRNLAPTWAPTWGSKKGPRLDFLELNMFFSMMKPGAGCSSRHFGPQGPPGPQN